MTVIDANILLYAYNEDAPQHGAVSSWLRALMESGETVGLPYVTVWAFLRIATNPRVWKNALSAEQAFRTIGKVKQNDSVVLLQPGPRHLDLLASLIEQHGVTGPLVSDAVLAALAMENGAWLASTDQDFSRFSGLRWINPLRLR